MHQNNLKIFYPLETGKDNKIIRTVCEEVEKITPEIKEFGKISEEACLSLPWDRGFVQRYQRVEVKYQDLKGKSHQQKYSGFNACIIQHEIDHLNWVLFIDKLIKEGKNWL